MEDASGLEPLSSVVSEDQVREIAEEFGTPVYAYSERLLEQQADKALAFPNAFGLTVRYAMKANSNINILKIFNRKGLDIDASSGEEAERAMAAEINPAQILLTSQKVPKNLKTLIAKGVEYNACSFHQLREYGKLGLNSEVSVRINPGLGSGGTNRTNTGGPASSFGIWHEQIPEILRIAGDYKLNIRRIHTHIGSGSDPEVWKKVAGMSLDIVEKFLDGGHLVQILNLGGGYKVGRMDYEKSTDLQECGEPVKESFMDFKRKNGNELKLEIEPGTFLVANAGCLIAKVEDIKSTPNYNFLITDSGMTEVTRPSLYGAQHPISVVPGRNSSDEGKKIVEYIVSGKCCESGDILSPAEGDSEALKPRELLEASIGDLAVVGGTGAYCSSMSTAGYNSYPRAAEVLIREKPQLIRARGTLEDLTRNELKVV